MDYSHPYPTYLLAFDSLHELISTENLDVVSAQCNKYIHITNRPYSTPTYTELLLRNALRTLAACSSNFHTAMEPQVPSVFWSLELHTSCGRSSHKTYTAAKPFLVCHKQRILLEAA